MPVLKSLSGVLNLPTSFLGCFESMPEETFGQKLAKARCYHSLPTRHAAKKLGVNERTFSSWEKDERLPSEKYADIIGEFLKILN
ncbi:MAG: helix-turn-helix domain-containing protein [Firmicutes bacterium]|nr:helix-turn-helix domain-containing protein [Bacillota bacterium]